MASDESYWRVSGSDEGDGPFMTEVADKSILCGSDGWS